MKIKSVIDNQEYTYNIRH